MAEEQPPSQPPERPKYRPWPKRREGHHRVTDKPKIRALYLASGKYAWTDFCRAQGFDPNPHKTQLFPVRAWQAEYTQLRIEEQNSEVHDLVLDLRKKIIKKRVDFTNELQESFHRSKTLLDGLKRKHLLDLQHDSKNETAIRSGSMAAKFNLKPQDLRAIVGTEQALAEIAAQSLLMPPGSSQAVLPLPAQEEGDNLNQIEDERLRTAEVTVMGTEGLPPEKVQTILASWFDHAMDHPEDKMPIAQEDMVVSEEGEEGGDSV